MKAKKQPRAKTVRGRRRLIQPSRTNSIVAKLTAAAKALPSKQPYVAASDLAPVVNMLYRDKGFTWKEIAEWLSARGHTQSVGSIANAWRHWCRTNNKPEKPR